MIKDTFKKAKEAGRAIIFIDEIDSIGIKRTNNRDQGYTLLLNQLLVEMNKLSSYTQPIIVIAATNRAEELDPALLRPGRFDLHISVELPDVDARKEILALYAKNTWLMPSVDLEKIAQNTDGFSAADIAYIMNQAKIIATRKKLITISNVELEEACKTLRLRSAYSNSQFVPTTSTTTLKDVIGAIEAKKEIATIISFLKDPEYYTRLGAKMPRGILLDGPPGVGKTLLALATAGEANCSFFQASGSDFTKKYVGEGPQHIKQLFLQARKHAPSIIFIDEIDSIGITRKQENSGAYAETLNQLLVEMDGFNKNNPTRPVIVMAATNRANLLDDALVRAGRFDRKISIGLPDLKTREKMLQYYIQKIKIDPSVNLSTIAKKTTGYSGADLAQLVNQATLIATNNSSDTVQKQDFEEAYNLITLGDVNSSITMSDHEKRVTAFHEAGHALVYLFSDTTAFTLDKVTIVPRGQALGLTSAQIEEEKYGYSKQDLFGRIQACLGGRIAEEIEFGIIGTGASNDIQQATAVAQKMVREYGMSDALGVVNYENIPLYSQKTAELIDEEIKKIINDSYNKTRALLLQHKDKLTKLAHALLEHETLDAEEIYTLLGLKPKSVLR